MEVLLRPWKLYADASGRSRRSEYWLFFTIRYGVVFALLALGDIFSPNGIEAMERDAPWIPMVAGVWALASFVPSCVLLVRRCHDFDATGKWALLSFVPYIGLLVMIVIGAIPGTRGENDRGFDPREPDEESVAEIFK